MPGPSCPLRPLWLPSSSRRSSGRSPGAVRCDGCNNSRSIKWNFKKSPSFPNPLTGSGGVSGIPQLDHTRSLKPATFSTLNLDTDWLERLIQRNPLVKAVEAIEVAYPKRVIVSLRYREPVARLLKGGVVIDDEGVLLPVDAIKPDFLDGLVYLSPESFAPPVDPHFGQPWCRKSDAPGGEVVADGRVLAAARLAAFLDAKIRVEPSKRDPNDPLGFVTIHDVPSPGLWVQLGKHLMIQWPDSPSGKLTDETRWTVLKTWLRDNPSIHDDKVTHLRFTSRGVEPIPGP